jgi:8-oxo-dGTP pyrophosphatase MutT (NUDIX family)
MERRNGPWTIKDSRVVYRNEFIEVVEDDVLQPDGESGSYATVRIKAGVSVLAFTDREVYLIRQFRYALGRESLEAVSGAVEEDESPADAAVRELQEEAGIIAGELVELGRIDVDTSIVNNPAYHFLARDLRFTESRPEGTEEIRVEKFPLEAAVRMVMASEITHASTCSLILKAQQYLTAKREAQDSKVGQPSPGDGPS